jgi:serine-type D-Ala-D-Ala endopeptidase (penicillin-binding protein 7)
MIVFCLQLVLVAHALAQTNHESSGIMREQLSVALKSAKPQAGQMTVLKVGANRQRLKTYAKGVKKEARSSKSQRFAAKPKRPSFGQMAGLQGTHDPLELRSNVAYVIDQTTHEVLVSKNDAAVLPIASLTKLMTGLLISEAKQSLDEPLAITQADVDTEKGSRSRLKVGLVLTRGELLHLALMSSENRAAHALARHFPGGLDAFVVQMNAKAATLGMPSTHYVEPTGLSSKNQSSAKDLAVLAQAAVVDPLLREYSTSLGYSVAVGRKTLKYNNTNRLVHNASWDIGLQKTGYISEAGRCLLMQANVAGRKLIMVFLDSVGTQSRLGDAERVRRWVESNHALQKSTI